MCVFVCVCVCVCLFLCLLFCLFASLCKCAVYVYDVYEREMRRYKEEVEGVKRYKEEVEGVKRYKEESEIKFKDRKRNDRE